MPTPDKNVENMRKHLTREERQAREDAERGMARAKRVAIHAPGWLSVEARRVFEATKRRMRGLHLLDNVDADLLALYSDAVVKYQLESEVKDKQAWSRLVLQYAEKLGISPTARARLARRSAEKREQDEFEQLLDDVAEYVNGAQ